MAQTINLDTSQRVDIICKRGDTFNLQLTIKNEGNPNVSGSYAMEVRPSDDSTGTATLAITGTANEAAGTVSFVSNAAAMAQLVSGLYVYDIENTDSSSNVSTLIYGTFKVNEDVTI